MSLKLLTLWRKPLEGFQPGLMLANKQILGLLWLPHGKWEEGGLGAGLEAGGRMGTYSWAEGALLNSAQQCEWLPLGLHNTVALGRQ